ncbi:MAG: Gfo/Idh/MocA family protein [Pseudomonadota bacterium]
MPTKTAIIGLGIMGRRMLANMRKHEAYAPDLLWDPSGPAREAALAEAPDARLAASAEEAIAEADLVYLACPPGPRKALSLAAAEAGKPVFLEKPLGVDLEESRDLVARLEASGVPTAVNFTQAAGRALNDTLAAAQSGDLGALRGVDIVVTYAQWPREWQKAADWLRFRAEGGFTREVVSHFVFFSERILGPLSPAFAHPSYPADPELCETHLLARLESRSGLPVTILGSVGGAQPDRQELTVKGERESRRITDFYAMAASTGGPFEPLNAPTPGEDPRAQALRDQLDDLQKMIRGEPHRLATLREALRVQQIVESLLAGV